MLSSTKTTIYICQVFVATLIYFNSKNIWDYFWQFINQNKLSTWNEVFSHRSTFYWQEKICWYNSCFKEQDEVDKQQTNNKFPLKLKVNILLVDLHLIFEKWIWTNSIFVLPISNLSFAGYTGSNNQVWNIPKMEFVKIHLSKIKCKSTRGLQHLFQN